jgi:K+/H+ antiporter YhaU regulatory subunit KhtT
MMSGAMATMGVTVLAVARADGQVVRHPDAETILRTGGRVRVFGLPEQIGAFVVALSEER